MSLPHVISLCPVFRQTKWLNSSIQSFVDQTYPDSHRELLILDDSGDMKDGTCSERRNRLGHPLWRVISIHDRLESIPAKYTHLVKSAPHGDVYCVWDAMDIYLPWHTEAVATVCPMRGFVMHEKQIVAYPGSAIVENSVTKAHGSLAISRHLLNEIGGWPLSRMGCYERDMISDLSKRGHRVEHYHKRGASYVYRWTVRQSYLGDAITRAMDSAFWYEDIERRTKPEGKRGSIVPNPGYDEECQSILAMFSA